MWSPDHALDILVRGTCVYLALFAAMRFLPRRTIGAMGAADLLVIVLIADAVQNAMAGGYESITDGLLLAFVIFGWATLIDWLDFRFPSWHIAAGKELVVIQDGRILHKVLAREQISEEELLSQLRLNGVDDVAKVRQAFIEPEGHVSVILARGRVRRRVQAGPGGD